MLDIQRPIVLRQRTGVMFAIALICHLVLISAPVGLCFLPAFIAVGVLPVVIGLAGGVLRGGGG